MNKMFKKIFAVVAACATVATMSVSAFAADAVASYGAGAVTVENYVDASGKAQQFTVMVFADGFETTVDGVTSYDVSKIYYINQGEDTDKLLKGMLVKGGTLADGDYTVRIGNDAGNAIDIEFTVGATAPAYFYGDVNASGDYPDLADAMEIIKYYLFEPSVLDNEEPWRMELANVSADRETNDTIDLVDAMEIIKYYLFESSTLDDLIVE